MCRITQILLILALSSMISLRLTRSLTGHSLTGTLTTVRVQQQTLRNHYCFTGQSMGLTTLSDYSGGSVRPPSQTMKVGLGGLGTFRGGYFTTMWDRKSRIVLRGHGPLPAPARSRRARDLGALLRYIPRHPSKALGISSSYKVELTGNHGKVTTEGGVFTPNVTFYTHTIPINREAHSG